MNKKSISLVLGIMCLALSCGIAIQVKTVNGNGTTVSTNARENELRDAVLKAKEKYDNLYSELEYMEEKLETERTNSTQNNTELEQLENEIKEGNKILGLSEVTGSGIVITLNDNNKISMSDYVGDLSSYLVHDADLRNIVNGLKNVGAEAISINEQRIITTSAIECDGNVILVNGKRISAPFVIKAIGYPEALKGINMLGGYLYSLREDRDLEVKIETSDSLKTKITIPKYTGIIKFEYAENK